MKVVIEKVSNGYILRDYTDDTEPESAVFEESNQCAVAHIQYLLYSLLDVFGESGSKHDQHRLNIKCKCEKDNG